MTKENIKELLPLVSAFSEDKIIQHNYNGIWIDEYNPLFNDDPKNYRIKEDPIYEQFTFDDSRLFKDKWIKLKLKNDEVANTLYRIIRIDNYSISIIASSGILFFVSYYNLLKDYVFENRLPCGKIKKEN